MRFFIVFLIICTSSCINKKQREVSHSIDSIKESEVSPKIISDSSNTVESNIQTLELEYVLWRCLCPKWVKPSDRIEYADDRLLKYAMYIEPADSSLNLPEDFNYATNYITVTGQFYIQEGFPKRTSKSAVLIDKGKIFRYFKIEIHKKSKYVSY